MFAPRERKETCTYLMKIHVAVMVLRKMNSSSLKQGEEQTTAWRSAEKSLRWGSNLIILLWGRLMQFWKALNCFPGFMIAYTALLEETGLTTNSAGRGIQMGVEKEFRAQQDGTSCSRETAMPALCEPAM